MLRTKADSVQSSLFDRLVKEVKERGSAASMQIVFLHTKKVRICERHGVRIGWSKKYHHELTVCFVNIS